MKKKNTSQYEYYSPAPKSKIDIFFAQQSWNSRSQEVSFYNDSLSEFLHFLVINNQYFVSTGVYL